MSSIAETIGYVVIALWVCGCLDLVDFTLHVVVR